MISLSAGQAEQLAVIGSRQGIPLGQAGGLHILVGSGDKNVIGLTEVTLIARQFVGVIIPIDLQVKIAAVDPIESIVPIQTEWQTSSQYPSHWKWQSR